MFSLSLCLLCAIVFCLQAVTQQVMYMQALQGISSSYWVFQLLHCKRCFGSDWLCLLPHLIRLVGWLKRRSVSLLTLTLYSASVCSGPQAVFLVNKRVRVMRVFLCRRPNSIPISCYQNLNLDGLLVKMWEMMALVCLPHTVKFIVAG